MGRLAAVRRCEAQPHGAYAAPALHAHLAVAPGQPLHQLPEEVAGLVLRQAPPADHPVKQVAAVCILHGYAQVGGGEEGLQGGGRGTGAAASARAAQLRGGASRHASHGAQHAGWRRQGQAQQRHRAQVWRTSLNWMMLGCPVSCTWLRISFCTYSSTCRGG